ncbi:MAG: fibrobacter succinogenes major paralogous domain-containing protein [Dysgonamonadaceae bacterium]|jgi:uncharacterized protein (TIGR02145 family)|nr:fibrobacter succinogenes major paralogous domain-containing protein [Dysgonamonadaceae bacterium]
MKTSIKILATALTSIAFASQAQIKIAENTANSAAMGSSAFIDASSNPAYNNSPNVGKGLLYPRVDLTTFTSFGGQPKGIPTSYPTYYDGFVVYNTAESGVAGIGGTEGSLIRGFWYYENTSSAIDGGTWKPLGCNCEADNSEPAAPPVPTLTYSNGDPVLFPSGTNSLNPNAAPVTVTASADGAVEYEWDAITPASDNSPADGLSLSGSGESVTLTGSKYGIYNLKVRAKTADGRWSEWKSETVSVGCGARVSASEWLAFMCYNVGAEPDMTFAEQRAWPSSGNLDMKVYGGLYQWGRQTDGHEQRNSGTVSTLADNPVPNHPYFILIQTSDYDWLSSKDATQRWGDGSDSANPPKGANDPCPEGWKIPSQAQWLAVTNSAYNPLITWWSGPTNGKSVGRHLFIPAGGLREVTSGNLYSVGDYCYLWTSVAKNDLALSMSYSATGQNWSSYGEYRAWGFSVRCVME